MPINDGIPVIPGEHLFVKIDNLGRMERYVFFIHVDDVFLLPDGLKVVEGRLVSEEKEEPDNDE